MADFTNDHIEQLRALAQDYDKANGRYPENKYEGLAVYSYIWHRLTGEPDPCRLMSFRSTEDEWQEECGLDKNGRPKTEQT